MKNDNNINLFLNSLENDELREFSKLFLNQDKDNEAFNALSLENNMVGQLRSKCNPPGRRPQSRGYSGFSDIAVIHENSDWTIFGMTTAGRSIKPIVIDLLESTGVFQIRIGTFNPWKGDVNDPNCVSYRLSENQLIIRCINVISTAASYCKINGMVAVRSNELLSPEF